MLAISDLHVAYGQSEVLHGLNVSVAPNEIIAIMGRNGMGKTTLMKSLMGIVPTKSGSVSMEGAELSERFARSAVALNFDVQSMEGQSTPIAQAMRRGMLALASVFQGFSQAAHSAKADSEHLRMQSASLAGISSQLGRTADEGASSAQGIFDQRFWRAKPAPWPRMRPAKAQAPALWLRAPRARPTR